MVAGPRNHHIRADLSAQQQGVIWGSALATCFPGRQIWIGRVGLSDPRPGLEVLWSLMSMSMFPESAHWPSPREAFVFEPEVAVAPVTRTPLPKWNGRATKPDHVLTGTGWTSVNAACGYTAPLVAGTAWGREISTNWPRVLCSARHFGRSDKRQRVRCEYLAASPFGR